MTHIATFKSPSKIVFKTEIRQVPKPRLSDTKRGETFLWAVEGGRDPAVCMRADVSVFRAICDLSIDHNIREQLEDCFKCALFITNLQTGRTFIAADCDIEYVRVVMTLDGE